MNFASPQPRLRILSEWKDYSWALRALVIGTYQQGLDCQLLEQKIASYLGVKHAVCLPQARVAIYAAIKALVPAGKEIILSPNTIADVINMVIVAGAKPVFCDIDPQTGNLDPQLVTELITPDTAAIMATHLYGLVAPMAELQEIAQKHNLAIIEDAAQAFGARQGSVYAGAFGQAGVFSFGMAKNLMSFWGGMVVTNSDETARNIRNLTAQWPIVSRLKLAKKIFSCFIKDIATLDFVFPCLLFPVFRLAYQKNIKGITRHMETELDLSRKAILPDRYKEQYSPLQARIACSKLGRVEADTQRRIKCARMYYEGLKDIAELTLPPMLDDGSHIYNYYTIGYLDRVDLRLYMLKNGRDAALQHIKNTADLPAFKDFYRDCPHSRAWAQRTIMMPNYAKYRFSEVEKNINVIRSYFGK